MNVLMAIDFSRVTTHMLDAVAKLIATPTGAASRVYLVHVAKPNPDFVGWGAGPEEIQDRMAAEFHREHRDLAALASTLRTKTDAEVTPLLVQGPTVETVCEVADKLSASMVVVGSHGHGATYDHLVGGVSSGIIGQCQVPVLVVPAPSKPR